MTNYCLVFCTCENEMAARELAMLLLQQQLAACVNILPTIESHYLWQGKLETSTESKLIIKTEQSKIDELIPFIKLHHSYEVPEIQVVPVIAGNQDYFNWINKVLS
ncbi:divalent-cation tolerance protein CutA [Pseudoalteromonas tunicata]|uniref:divalent-cation tolerance protein CutA n=1 Tax=Pseudoalteromonas tunicata TaxID=314281 RepID=UPI0003186001|nr:divalent-cation tolerance protein CutA [Pseudoalteromonas tunicata]ATC95989.1 periplasmic divalent cation tolerance protein [Pseudoalteromonas tunicata]MDP4984906.1 divalent-cation tolerance protein CutA [Pseudoalteromonas tunicata]MDP5213348.1 divalent-cation tolerance protein CutA [Pseudoalteromonas tunicata]